ncbi:MAG: yneA [Mycobacterium sp.]|nr:yneA [Mycobacterium sp.]
MSVLLDLPARSSNVRGVGQGPVVWLAPVVELRPAAGRSGGGRAATAAAPGRRVTGATRLTRRGRLTVVFLVLIACGVLSFAVRGAFAGAAESGRPPLTVQVQAGDTLWTLATRVAPGVDPTTVVRRLRTANHLHTDQIEPGQHLVYAG